MINDIRIASNGLYGLKTPTPSNNEEQTADFSKMMNAENQKEEPENKINLYSLGAPAGFFADISMISEADAKEIGILQI